MKLITLILALTIIGCSSKEVITKQPEPEQYAITTKEGLKISFADEKKSNMKCCMDDSSITWIEPLPNTVSYGNPIYPAKIRSIYLFPDSVQIGLKGDGTVIWRKK